MPAVGFWQVKAFQAYYPDMRQAYIYLDTLYLIKYLTRYTSLKEQGTQLAYGNRVPKSKKFSSKFNTWKNLSFRYKSRLGTY